MDILSPEERQYMTKILWPDDDGGARVVPDNTAFDENGREHADRYRDTSTERDKIRAYSSGYKAGLTGLRDGSTMSRRVSWWLAGWLKGIKQRQQQLFSGLTGNDMDLVNDSKDGRRKDARDW